MSSHRKILRLGLDKQPLFLKSKFAVQIMSGISAMHDENIMHSDIKPMNIVFSEKLVDNWGDAINTRWRKIWTKFSGEPRDARKNHGIWPYFGRISSKIVFKTQNKTLAKFQILASDSEIDLHSEIENYFPKSKPLIPLESDLET